MWTEDRILKNVFMFLLGGFLYYFLEIAVRGYSHYSMIICGGLAFLLSGLLNQVLGFQVALVSQMVLSACMITGLEFFTGLIVNVWLEMDVWDYSDVPYNLMGQICLPYSMLWMVLSLACIFLDDWIRYRLFGEEKATYKIF
ncbi:MAG: putative ABC transporter permease [Lachnospiraceae bacterium]|nr:putative ABC transporter permease [Lachnospiraceae bacterium]